MSQPTIVIRVENHLQLKLINYVIGFVGCSALTFMAYLLVSKHAGNISTIVELLAGLAVTQFLVQMVLFLHIAEEKHPRWRLVALLFMLGIVLIVVFGSIWIMNNLNYRMMNSPEKQRQYLKSQDSI